MIRVILFLLALFVAAPVQAAERDVPLDMRVFQNMPIVYKGRVQPISSFSRSVLQELSGRKALEGLSAPVWLALTLFDPVSAAALPVIAVEDKAVAAKLGLEPGRTLYSYQEVQPGLEATQDDVQALLQKKDADLTAQENALLHVHEKAALLTNVMRSFSGLLPLDIVLPKTLQDDMIGPPTYGALSEMESELRAGLDAVMARKGRDPSRYTPEELGLAQAMFQLETLRAGGQSSDVLRVMPLEGQWVSPWTALLSGAGEDAPGTEFLLSQWQELAASYRSFNAPLWQAVSADLLQETFLQSAGEVRPLRLNIERLYLQTHPYIWVAVLYGLALAACALSRQRPGLVLALLGAALHLAALVARSYILERVPVGTLYESVLFVSLICAGVGAFFARGRGAWSIAGLAASLVLLAVAPLFQTGESLEVLVAVLNTNFWLSTHVLVITAGYGLCILTACLAHFALYKNDEALHQGVYRLSLAALLFMAVGTILGGIWADQSWGRFWGWDPKENGALLIVLWLIWAQHGRHSGTLSFRGFAATMAGLNIVVALSWFGVNLLSVGLHSYGFTSGLAGGLAAFCAAQLGVILMLVYRRRNA